MDATPHLVMGAALTMRVRKPLLAVGIGMLSHVVLDMIPHYHLAWIMGARGFALVDLALGICLTLVVVALAPVPWGSLMGAFGGALPALERVIAGQRYDFLERPPFGLPHLEAEPPWGVATEIAATVTALALAVRQRKYRRT